MAKTPLSVTDNSCLTRTFFMEGHWSYETTFTRPSKNFAKREQSPQGSQWRNIIKISSPHPPTVSIHTGTSVIINDSNKNHCLASFPLPLIKLSCSLMNKYHGPVSWLFAIACGMCYPGVREKHMYAYSAAALSLPGARYSAHKQFTASDGLYRSPF